MFIVEDAENGGTRYYTRAGNFYLDEEGYIVNSDGYYLLSTEGSPIQIEDNVQSVSIADDGTVNIVDEDGNPNDRGQIGLALFSNPAGLEKVGNNLFLISDNAGLNDANGGIATPNEGGA